MCKKNLNYLSKYFPLRHITRTHQCHLSIIRFIHKIPGQTLVEFSASPGGYWQAGCLWWEAVALQLRHNGRDSVSNRQPHDCLLNCLFRRRWKKTSKLRVTGLCVGNSPLTGEFPAQMASYAENVSIWWRHHGVRILWGLKSNFVWENDSMGLLLGQTNRRINALYASRMKSTWDHSKTAVEEVSVFRRLKWCSFNYHLYRMEQSALGTWD